MTTKVLTYSEQVDLARKKIIEDCLKRHGGNKTHAAWELRIDRQSISRLVKKYGIEGTR